MILYVLAEIIINNMHKSASLQILRERYKGTKVKVTRTPELENMLCLFEDSYQLNRSRIIRYILGEYLNDKARQNLHLPD